MAAASFSWSEVFIFLSTLGLLVTNSLGLFFKRTNALTDVLSFVLPQTCLILRPDLIVKALVLALLLFTVSVVKRITSKTFAFTPDVDLLDGAGRRCLMLDNYRGSTMLMIIICIFACDFSFFPGAHFKTKIYGLSLMDVGIGSMIYNGGLVSSRSSRAGFTQSLVLFACGVVRYQIMLLLKYAYNVREYGVHWNFFFTLAFVALFTEVCKLIRCDNAVFGVILLASYQTLLWGGIEGILLSKRRSNIFLANKEGLCSSVGMLAMSLVSRDIGRVLFRSSKPPLKTVLISAASAIFLAVYFALKIFFPPSRCFANATYCVWILGFHTLHLTIHLLTCAVFSVKKIALAVLISQNQLVVFVMANIILGVINMIKNMRELPNTTGFCIFMLYLLASVYSPIAVSATAKRFSSAFCKFEAILKAFWRK